MASTMETIEMLRDFIYKSWTVGESLYDQRAGIGVALISAGTTMLGYNWH